MRDHLLWAARADLHGLGEPAELRLPDGDGGGVEVGLVVGIDTGGTFTDMVVFDPATGEVDSLKTSSTPATPGQAIVNALDEGGVAAAELETFTHGTTVGTNALIERTGCKVAFVTTKGFEDTPYIQRINRKVLYDLRWTKPQPLVASRRLCLGLEERLDSAGRRGEARRRGGGAAARAHDPRGGRRGGRALPALLLRQHRPRGARQGDPRGGAAGRAGLGLVRGGADLARVRALVDDDRGRLPPPAVRPLRRAASTARCATPA